jgi:uncharacterized protein (TIGR02597 family)
VAAAILLSWSEWMPAQATSSSPVVGFMKMTLQGAATGSGENLVGPALLGKVEFQGVILPGLPAAFSLTVNDAAWSANQFDTLADGNSHFVEVVSSSSPAAVGRTTDIVSHSADTLTTLDDLSGVLQGGETIAIRRHKTISDLFGTANESGLGAGDPTTADGISILTSGPAASFSTYYFRSGAPIGGTGWRSSANPFVDASATPVRAGEGLLIKRRQQTALEVTVFGYIKTGTFSPQVKSGYNLIDPLVAVSDQSGQNGVKFTLGGVASATIVPSGLEQAFTPGSTLNADRISLYNPTGGFTTYYLKSGGIGGTGWRTTSNPFTDAMAVELPAGAGFLIQNLGAPKVWSRPQPFVIAPP